MASYAWFYLSEKGNMPVATPFVTLKECYDSAYDLLPEQNLLFIDAKTNPSNYTQDQLIEIYKLAMHAVSSIQASVQNYGHLQAKYNFSNKLDDIFPNLNAYVLEKDPGGILRNAFNQMINPNDTSAIDATKNLQMMCIVEALIGQDASGNSRMLSDILTAIASLTVAGQDVDPV